MEGLTNYKKALIFVIGLLILVHIASYVYVFTPMQVKMNFVKQKTVMLYKKYIGENFFRSDTEVIEKQYFDFVIFTTLIPLEKRYVAYNNTKRNWPSLSNNSKAVLFTNLADLAEEFIDAGWDVSSEFDISSVGIPTLTSMFKAITKHYKASFIGYANADMLFTDGLTKTLLTLKKNLSGCECHIMATGRRKNVNHVTEEEAKTFQSLFNASRRGILHRSDAEDYFFTDYEYPWYKIPDFVIGRVAYDNFLLAHARTQNYTTYDFTRSVDAIHQTVDQGHLEKSKRASKDRNYNNKLINKRFRGVNYYAGMTGCLSHVTVRRAGNITIEKRNPKSLAKFCSIRMVDMLQTRR